MSTYKVIQDIEADDHILGPLSFRQFIYALIAAFSFYLSYLTASHGAGVLMVLFLPPGLFCAFFAFPFGRDQPTEVWALAKLRYLFKPRRRIWDQTGVKELVTITVPKKVEVHRTDGLSQHEVRSRLTALANTIDSRGWALKNSNLNLYSNPRAIPADTESDRLVATSSMAQDVPAYDVHAADDILDSHSNAIAQQFDQMITASAQAHRDQLVGMMQQTDSTSVNSTPQINAPNWFMQQPSPATTVQTPVSNPSSIGSGVITQDDAAISNQLKARGTTQDVTYGHMKTIQPISEQTAVQAQPPVAQPQNPATPQLAANNDLNISTIARVANKQDTSSDNEVIIPLH
jgi:hypothetical protein